ncbi:MAG: hypothetical protein EXS16_03460 [Gemmataceae bacterium]|nr:hypothetical protein [Gemmataceae bacterium]
MSTATVQPEAQPLVDDFRYPPTNLPEEDGTNLESDWHRLEMTLLIELVGLLHRGRDDYFVGGNMFIYFDEQQASDRNFRGPDFFFVKEASLNPPRGAWYVWGEGGKYPDVIIELTSPTTANLDHGIKKDTYERVFHTSEYFIYNPAEQKLLGWRLKNGRYHSIESNEQSWLWSEQFGLWLGLWAGKYQGKEEVYLRFFDKDGDVIPAALEIADVERRRGEAASQRAEAEKQRAEAAEAELRQLRAAQKPAQS